jgi:hypothetical protein
VLGTALATGNLLKNAKNLSGAGISGELLGLLGNGRNLGGIAAAGIAGVSGIASAGIKLFKGNNDAAKKSEGEVQATPAETNSTPADNNENPATPPPAERTAEEIQASNDVADFYG